MPHSIGISSCIKSFLGYVSVTSHIFSMFSDESKQPSNPACLFLVSGKNWIDSTVLSCLISAELPFTVIANSIPTSAEYETYLRSVSAWFSSLIVFPFQFHSDWYFSYLSAHSSSISRSLTNERSTPPVNLDNELQHSRPTYSHSTRQPESMYWFCTQRQRADRYPHPPLTVHSGGAITSLRSPSLRT